MKKLFQVLTAIIFVFSLVAATTVIGRANGEAKPSMVAVVQKNPISVSHSVEVLPAPYAITNCFGAVERSTLSNKEASSPSISARAKEKLKIVTPFTGLPAQHYARADPSV